MSDGVQDDNVLLFLIYSFDYSTFIIGTDSFNACSTNDNSSYFYGLVVLSMALVIRGRAMIIVIPVIS